VAQRTLRGRRAVASREDAPVTDEADVLRRGLEAFAELGYEATTVRELAKRLGVSHNYINDRYESKLGFWTAVIDSAARPLFEELMVADRASSDEERLVTAVTVFCRGAVNSPEINRIVADESVRDSDRLAYLFEEYVSPWWSQLTPTIKRLMKAGRIAPVPMNMVFFAITWPALALTQKAMAHRLRRDADKETSTSDQLAELVLTGLLPMRGKQSR
jgi:TetR/AcrR family transcriptional regulator